MQKGKIQSIQLMRALAVVSVVILHSVEGMYFLSGIESGGWLLLGSAGVDLFFVISGFVMLYILECNQVTAGAFLKNRLVRVMPLYFVYTSLALLVTYFFTDLESVTRLFHGDVSLERWVASITLLPVKSESGGYPFLMVGWSLQYELYFYCVVALSIFLFGSRNVALASVSILFLVVSSRMFFGGIGPLRFFGSPIVFEFMLGMLIAKIFLSNYTPLWQALNKIKILLLALAFIMFYFSATNINWAHRFISLGLPCSFVFIYVLFSVQSVPLWLSEIGNASYTIYLAHSFVILLCVAIFKDFFAACNHSYAAFFGLLVALVSVIFGFLLYCSLEKPLLKTIK